MIEKWIHRLQSVEKGVREAAALDLYRVGRKLGEEAIRNWQSDADFRNALYGQPVVGVAVGHDTFDRIRSAWGSPRLANVPPDQDAEEFDLHIQREGKEAWLDILRPRTSSPDGPIARFLGRLGEGIQQVEFFVLNVDEATKVLRERYNVKWVHPETRKGADDFRVNFTLAETCEGAKVLIELVEVKRAQHGVVITTG
jgi:methylmalonyl-CoA/ethylmalonyl-CoA epimerase